MGDHPEQQFEWALKNGDMDQVKVIVGKVFYCCASCCRAYSSLLAHYIRISC